MKGKYKRPGTPGFRTASRYEGVNRSGNTGRCIFLTSTRTLDGDECSASRTGRSVPRERFLINRRLADPRLWLDTGETEILLLPGTEPRFLGRVVYVIVPPFEISCRLK